MKFQKTEIDGLLLLEWEPIRDERGYFARIYHAPTFEARGLEIHWEQWALVNNLQRGTLRGLHFQTPPYEEVKVVRCLRGAIFDVAVDLREDSPTRWRWVGRELTAANGLGFYIPRGFAHGYVTLQPDTEVLYALSGPYRPESASGLRYDDPALNITWPVVDPILNDRDRNYPLLGKRSSH